MKPAVTRIKLATGTAFCRWIIKPSIFMNLNVSLFWYQGPFTVSNRICGFDTQEVAVAVFGEELPISGGPHMVPGAVNVALGIGPVSNPAVTAKDNCSMLSIKLDRTQLLFHSLNYCLTYLIAYYIFFTLFMLRFAALLWCSVCGPVCPVTF